MWWFVDCRHGRALLRARDWADLLVWDPITAERRLIPVPHQIRAGASDCNAAVLCPSAAGDGDDHPSPFNMVVVFTSHGRASACVYSSLTGAWGQLVSTKMPLPPCELSEEPGALVGDALYWLLGESSILEFQFQSGNQILELVERPLETFSVYKRNIRVMRSEVGLLGLAAVKNLNLHLWAREPNHGGAAKWVLHREIELCTVLQLPLMQPRVGLIPVWISGLGENGNVVFLRTMVGIFMVWPETMQFKMVTNNVLIKTVYPYAGFYFPEEVGTGR
uniref:F-box protein AT5G49610-like beta-propeller domain-containing protein n=1 Tax=Arundo donax TaxID=35708 RepID=A0A0A9DET9_ARUDO